MSFFGEVLESLHKHLSFKVWVWKMLKRPEPRRLGSRRSNVPVEEPRRRGVFHVRVKALFPEDLRAERVVAMLPSADRSLRMPETFAQWRMEATMFLPTPNWAMASESRKTFRLPTPSVFKTAS